jgi:spore germination protein GerM
MRRGRIASVALLLAGGTAACGIPADDAPRSITQEQPDDLVPEVPVTSDGQTLLVDLYFTRFDGSRDKIVPIERAVPTGGSSSRPTPATVLETLLGGATEADRQDQNVVSKIPDGTVLDGQPELDAEGVLTVNLTEAINGVQGDGARLAYGQMVCTAVDLDEVDGVLFTVDDQPVQAPTGDGDTTGEPLTCESYANLLEPSAD